MIKNPTPSTESIIEKLAVLEELRRNMAHEADLYQMAAYLGRFIPPDGKNSWGVLAYPYDPARPTTPHAEQFSPWSLDGGRKIAFTALPHVASDAVIKLRDLLVSMTSERHAR